jgi:hypothetical protein
MASDPRLNLFNFAGTILNRNPGIFGVAHADNCENILQQSFTAGQESSRALGQTLGVVGAFANLANDIGGGTVGKGLSYLAGVSDAVRLGGTSKIPQAAIGNGQAWVLQAVGIDTQQLNTAGQFNPSVANNALNGASQVYNSVSQGKFHPQDIPAAFSAFQNGSALITSLFTPSSPATEPQASQFGQTCGVGNYATDLIKFAPKYKFLFVVQFEFDPAFNDIIGKHGGRIDPAFVVKSTTRPNIDFEYEDVNMYNFRTKVAKKTTYQPITMKFLDDDRNNAFQFYTTYLKLLSPIANVDAELSKVDPLQAYDIAGGGMGFENGGNPINASWRSEGQFYAGSLGTFGNSAATNGPETRNILRRISIFHVYRQGTLMNVMHFYNPKISKMELDDLDMASSEGTEVSFTFNYDSLFIIPGYQVFGPQIGSNYNLNDQTNDGLFPLGISPNSSIQNWDQRDGFGLASGQTTLNSDLSAQNIVFSSTPLPDTTTLAGSNLTAMASVAPSKLAGGIGTVLNQNGNNLAPLAVATKTLSSLAPLTKLSANPSTSTSVTAAVRDPVTGTKPASANNTANVAKVSTAAQQASAQINTNYNNAVAAATTPEQVQAAQQTASDALANNTNTNFVPQADIVDQPNPTTSGV